LTVLKELGTSLVSCSDNYYSEVFRKTQWFCTPENANVEIFTNIVNRLAIFS